MRQLARRHLHVLSGEAGVHRLMLPMRAPQLAAGAAGIGSGRLADYFFDELLPFVDAMNIDLKGFSADYYHWLGGDLKAVQAAIVQSAANCHVEVTTLILPGKNDGEAEMAAEARWLASLSPELPLHISRFFPRHQLLELPATPVETIRHLCSTAGKYLRWVYVGNC